jgi:Protein of unknown function (DUF732)
MSTSLSSEPQPDSSTAKGRGVRVHKAINRTLATVALLLSIIVLLALVVFGVRVVQALNDVGNALDELGAPLSSAATETPPTTDGECVGYGCSPEQDAELNESEREANDGIPDEATTAAEIAAQADVRVANGEDPAAVYDDSLIAAGSGPLPQSQEDRDVRQQTAADVCSALDSGQTPDAVASELAGSGTLTIAEADVIVGAAVGTYCSEHILDL